MPPLLCWLVSARTLRASFWTCQPTQSSFHLLDRVESPITVRVLRFERLASLKVTPHDPEDTDPLFIDSIIGVQRTGLGFDFHTDRFAISFRCGTFVESTRAA